MAGDFILPSRQAIINAMAADAPLTAMVAAASIYGATVPASRTFPFIRAGTFIATPFRASCLDAASIRFSIQVHSKPLMNATTTIEYAEDRAIKIGSAIKDAIDGRTLALAGGGKITITWVTSSPRMDGTEAAAWMNTVTFVGEVTA